LFALVSGMLSPNFGEFFYFYVTNVRHVSQFGYVMHTTFGTVSSVIAIILFNKYLKDMEFKYLMWAGVVTSLI